MKVAPSLDRGSVILVCLSGSGDKDSFEVAAKLGIKINSPAHG